MREFWQASSEMKRRQLGQERREVILKALVKRFFNEKEVTSTLFMDALYTACKFLFWTTAQQPAPAAPTATKAAKGRKGGARPSKVPVPAARDSKAWSPREEGGGGLAERPAEVIALDSRCFRVNGDLLVLLERAARDDGTPLLKADGVAGTAARGKVRTGWEAGCQLRRPCVCQAPVALPLPAPSWRACFLIAPALRCVPRCVGE